MAEEQAMDNGNSQHDLRALLSTENRDFLIRNNGDQVKISDLDGKKVGLYFSASWCGPCRQFTPILSEVYQELSPKGFEVVFVSADEDEESFNGYFSKMPWFAVPFSDATVRDKLNELFSVAGIPHLVILDEKGEVINEDGVQIIREYGAEGYPFNSARIDQLKEEEEAAKKNQTLRSVLVSSSRDFLISSKGDKVPVSELEGKMVGLYFSLSTFRSCREFMPKLLEVYNKLKERGENFEIVMIPLDDDEESFKEGFEEIPWLSLPFKDKSCEKLARYFDLETLPTLVILGPDGKTLNSNVAELVEEHGVQAYPFSPEKLAELEELEKARRESQTLESLLVSGEKDFVIGKGGVKVPVASLVGKHILLYFSARWCGPCRAFLPKLIQVYNEIKAKDEAFEVVFVSSDKDQSSYEDFFSSMPWLALPFGDERKKSLSRTFKIQGIPSLVAIAPSGRTITKDARSDVMLHGSDAYPFTEERLNELEKRFEDMAKGCPDKIKHDAHPEHELLLTRRKVYNCDVCRKGGSVWSYYCEGCDFDVHLKCDLGEQKGETEMEEDQADDDHDNPSKEGGMCEGGVCRKA